MTQVPHAFSHKLQLSISRAINCSVSISLPACAFLREVLAAFLDDNRRHTLQRRAPSAPLAAEIVLGGPGAARAAVKLRAGDMGVGNVHTERRKSCLDSAYGPSHPFLPPLKTPRGTSALPTSRGGEREIGSPPFSPNSYTAPTPAVHTCERKQPSPADIARPETQAIAIWTVEGSGFKAHS